MEDTGLARYAYVVAGCIFCVPSLLFAVAYCIVGPSLLRKKPQLEDTDISDFGPKPKAEYQSELTSTWNKHKTIILLLVLPNIFANTVVEVTPNNFLAAYVVKELCWENHMGSYVISVYRIGFFLGRLLSVPLSAQLKPLPMLAGGILVRIVAFVVMSCVSLEGSLMWLSVALLGLGCGNTFPTALLYLSQYMRVTGTISAIVIICTSLTSILDPLLFGYVFDSPARNWIIYGPLVMVIFHAVTLLMVECYAQGTRPKGGDEHVDNGGSLKESDCESREQLS